MDLFDPPHQRHSETSRAAAEVIKPAPIFTGASVDEVWPLVRDHHYSGRLPASAKHCFVARMPGGLFGDTGEPLAAALYGNPVNKYMPPTSIELLRLVRHPRFESPLSQFLAWTIRWLRANKNYLFILTYADSAENHHGGIYQAVGFVYCGERGVPGDGIAGFETGHGFVHARTCNARYGTHRAEKILDRFPDWQVVQALPKHFYIKPLRQKLKPILRRLDLVSLPYPKPNAACPLDAPAPADVSQAQPLEAAPYQKHSETSRAAAESIKPGLNALQRRVLEVIRLEPSWGATDEEIQDMTGMNPSTERPRRIELCDKGLIRDSGKTRATKSGRQATVWVVA